MSKFSSFEDHKRQSSSRKKGYLMNSLGLTSTKRSMNYESFSGEVFKQVIGGKEKKVKKKGTMVTGWLLGDEKVAANSLINVHFGNDKYTGQKMNAALCATSLDASKRCPICDGYSKAKKAGTQHDYPYKAKSEMVHVPFLVPDFQDEWEDTTSKGGKRKELLPLYLFKLQVTNYIDTHRENFDRFAELIRNPKILSREVTIYAPTRDTKQEYFFKISKEARDIELEHPLIDDWLGEDDDGRFEYSDAYAEMVQSIAILQYERAIDPATGKEIEYIDDDTGEDIYTRAEEFYLKEIDEHFPYPAKIVEEEEEEEIDEEDVPF